MRLIPKYFKVAQEWAQEVSKYHGNERIVSEHVIWGFEEVNKGRNPDTVLKEVLKKIDEAVAAKPN